MSPTQRAAMEQALEALESFGRSPYVRQQHPKRFANANKAAIALRAALAEQQEPVADFKDWYDNAIWGNEDFKQGCERAWNAAIKHTAPQPKAEQQGTEGGVCGRCGGLVYDPVIPQDFSSEDSKTSELHDRIRTTRMFLKLSDEGV